MAVLDLTAVQLMGGNYLNFYGLTTFTSTLRFDNIQGPTQNTTDNDGYTIEFTAEFTQLEWNAFYNTLSNNFKFEIDGNIITPTVAGTGNQYFTIATGLAQTEHFVRVTALTTNCILNSIRLTGTPVSFNTVQRRFFYNNGVAITNFTNPRDLPLSSVIASRGGGTPGTGTTATLRNVPNTYVGQEETFRFTGTGIEGLVLADANINFKVFINGVDMTTTPIVTATTGTANNTYKIIPIIQGLAYGTYGVRILWSGHIGGAGASGGTANGWQYFILLGGSRSTSSTAISATSIVVDDQSKFTVGRWVEIDSSPNKEYRQVTGLSGSNMIQVAALSKAHTAPFSIQTMDGQSFVPPASAYNDIVQNGLKVLGIGDSITMGTRVDESSTTYNLYDTRLSYFHRACRTLGYNGTCLAYQGRNTANVAGLTADFTTYRGQDGKGYDAVVIMLGTNDLNQGVSTGTSNTNYRNILVALKSAPGITTKTPIICLAIFSGGAGQANLATYNAGVVLANVTLLKSEGYNAIYKDLTTTGGWNFATMVPDTLHPNSVGKVILQNNLTTQLKTSLPLSGYQIGLLEGVGINPDKANALAKAGFTAPELMNVGFGDLIATRLATRAFTADDLVRIGGGGRVSPDQALMLRKVLIS